MMITTTDEAIREYCEKRKMRFKPWEITPWDVDSGACPYSRGSGGFVTWKRAQRLREQILDELGEDEY